MTYSPNHHLLTKLILTLLRPCERPCCAFAHVSESCVGC